MADWKGGSFELIRLLAWSIARALLGHGLAKGWAHNMGVVVVVPRCGGGGGGGGGGGRGRVKHTAVFFWPF